MNRMCPACGRQLGPSGFSEVARAAKDLPVSREPQETLTLHDLENAIELNPRHFDSYFQYKNRWAN